MRRCQTAVLAGLLLAPLSAQDLPRVLLIGDSISGGYRKPVVDLLEGKAEVHRQKGNAGPSSRGVEKLEQWLKTGGSDRWDVIHFNHGLHDLAWRKASGRGLDKKNGKRWASLAEYRQNLETITQRLLKTRAELIFATTTPVPEGEPGRVPGDDDKFNAVAREVMHKYGVTINDLHGLVAPRMAELATRPGNVHFKREGSQILAEQVVACIEGALRQRQAHKPKKGQARPRFKPSKKVVYKKIGDVTLHMHVFEPLLHKPGDRRPAALFFFGGGWNGGSPSQFYPHCEYLASRGMVAMAAEYRVRSRHKTSPYECVADGKSALAWLRQNADRLGVDTDKIAIGGGSAGGHVAAAVVCSPSFADAETQAVCKAQALLLFNPVYDNGPEGYGHKRVQARWKEISPMHNIRRGMPPAIVFLGSKDRLIPVATAERFKAAMEAVGSRSELEVYEGAGHGFFNHGRGDGSAYKDTVRKMDRFLASLMFIEGQPTLRP